MSAIDDPGSASQPRPIPLADPHQLGRAFADPNSLDDQKLAHSFIESNSSRKKHHHILPHLPKKPANPRILRLFILGVVVVFLLVFLIGYLPRHSRDKQIAQRAQAERNALPIVEVQQIRRTPSTDTLTIPGTTTPLIEANIYARSNGYVTRRLVDIGDHVRNGQLLAVVDSPDLDQQVDQARQQLDQAIAQKAQQNTQLALTKVTVERWRVLVAKGVFSRQDGDQTETNYQAQIANVAAAQRNVDAYQSNLGHLIALQQFERVTAPFPGIITARNFDVGALVSASGSANSAGTNAPESQSTGSTAAITNSAGTTGSAPTAATPSTGGAQGGALFSIVDLHRLRILVSVPEAYAASIHIGQRATLNFAEFPQTTFHGEVTRTANAIDQNTRTLLVEVQIPNPDGKLMSGMYAVVNFGAPAGPGSILIPGDAIVIRRDKSMVAVLTPDQNHNQLNASGDPNHPQQQTGIVHFQPVAIGRDYGASTEILSGLKEGDLIAPDVTDEVTENARVQLRTTSSPGQNNNPRSGLNQTVPPGGPSQYGNQAITDANMQGQQQKQQQKGSSQNKGKSTNSGSKP
ncbi:MAG TPA: efflux RND transporter periplasmic adaptor subunit [Granulicella sp.]|nr:efflux RND transporter periplasmic adaptor subunit [Granulicella sp.]